MYPLLWSKSLNLTLLIKKAIHCASFPGLQPSNKSSTFPVRMENSVPIVPQNQSAQSLQIQPSMLTQVRASLVWEYCRSHLETNIVGLNSFFNFAFCGTFSCLLCFWMQTCCSREKVGYKDGLLEQKVHLHYFKCVLHVVVYWLLVPDQTNIKK